VGRDLRRQREGGAGRHAASGSGDARRRLGAHRAALGRVGVPAQPLDLRAGKQALSFLAEELALELGPEITVNAVAPGQIAESADDIAAYDPSFVERAIAHTPAGRLVTRAEVAELVVALCGPSFDMVTGATLPVDGGWRLQHF
jgi:NAD(P)-dependent dehydrogenase (short-subunit alcohol dehydrogenase family)